MGFLVAAVLVTVLAARSSAAPKRPKMTCAAYGAQVASSTKSLGHEMKLKVGDWADVPAALRVLPPRTEMCGSLATTVFVTSPLFGKELEDYYRPIFEKMGCKPVTCEVTEKKSHCDCHGAGGFGRVGTEEGVEAYGISWMKFGKG
jgi:hypothetical protein